MLQLIFETEVSYQPMQIIWMQVQKFCCLRDISVGLSVGSDDEITLHGVHGLMVTETHRIYSVIEVVTFEECLGQVLWPVSPGELSSGHR